jgi:hypothetical protein
MASPSEFTTYIWVSTIQKIPIRGIRGSLSTFFVTAGRQVTETASVEKHNFFFLYNELNYMLVQCVPWEMERIKYFYLKCLGISAQMACVNSVVDAFPPRSPVTFYTSSITKQTSEAPW